MKRKFHPPKVKTIPVKWVHERHDTDKDGRPNFMDCNPWNPHEHGKVTDWLTGKVNSFRTKYTEPRQATLDEQYQPSTPQQKTYRQTTLDEYQQPPQQQRTIQSTEGRTVYVIAKLRGGQWYNIALVNSREGATQIINQLKQNPYVEKIALTRDVGEVDRRNKLLRVSQPVSNYIESRKPQWKQNVQQGLKSNQRVAQERRMAMEMQMRRPVVNINMQNQQPQQEQTYGMGGIPMRRQQKIPVNWVHPGRPFE